MPTLSLPAETFLAAWGFLAMNVLTPGPNVLNTIALAIGSGRRAALGAAAGTGIGILIWCLGMVLGVAALLAAMPVARVVMTLVAIGLLVWFSTRYLRAGVAGLRARRAGHPATLAGRAGIGFAGGFWRSVSILMANPKALTTWLTLTALFPVARAGAPDITVLTLGACLVAATIHGGYALAFSTPRAARGFLRAAPVIQLAVGLFFAAFALSLAVSQLSPGP